MSDIIAAASTNSTQALDAILGQPAGPGSERTKQKALGQADFFKLLTTQLASQDPLEPLDDKAFIAQMASFSELEMMSQMNKNFDKFTNLQQFQASQGYIGKKVTMLVEGEEISGVADGLEHIDGTTRVFVDGRGYNIDSVFKVERVDGGQGNGTTN